MVASNRKIGGFSGSWDSASAEVQRKRQFLQSEGVRFDSKGIVLAECLHEFERGVPVQKRKR